VTKLMLEVIHLGEEASVAIRQDGAVLNRSNRYRYYSVVAPLVVAGLLVGCGGSTESTATDSTAEMPAETTLATPPPATTAAEPGETSMGFTHQNWVNPATAADLRANLTAAGYPDWWPVPDTINPTTVDTMNRWVFTVEGEPSLTLSTGWLSPDTDLEKVTEFWRKRIPVDVISLDAERIVGEEDQGIFGKPKFIDLIQRDEAGFAIATARVIEEFDLDNNVVGSIFKLDTTPANLSKVYTTGPQIWSFVDALPNLGLTIDSSSFDVFNEAQTTTASIGFVVPEGTSEGIYAKLLDRATWTTGATFVQSEDSEFGDGKIVTFSVGNNTGTVRLPNEPAAALTFVLAAKK
jgi:hypothetical protein